MFTLCELRIVSQQQPLSLFCFLPAPCGSVFFDFLFFTSRHVLIRTEMFFVYKTIKSFCCSIAHVIGTLNKRSRLFLLIKEKEISSEARKTRKKVNRTPSSVN